MNVRDMEKTIRKMNENGASVEEITAFLTKDAPTTSQQEIQDWVNAVLQNTTDKPDTEQVAIKMYKDGKSVEEIAQHFSVSDNDAPFLEMWVKNLVMDLPKPNLTPREQMELDDMLDQEIIAMGLDEETARQIREQADASKESKWHANGQLKQSTQPQVISPTTGKPIKPNHYQRPFGFQASNAVVRDAPKVEAPKLTPELMEQIRKIKAVKGAMRIPGDDKDPESLRVTFHPVVIHHEPSNTNRLIPSISFSVIVRNWGYGSPVVQAFGSVRTNQGALHPHIHSQQGNPCWGEAHAHLTQAVKLCDWVMLINIIAMWCANSKQTGGYVNTLDYFPKTDLPTGYVADQDTWKAEKARLATWEAQETLKTKLRTIKAVRDIRVIDNNKYFVHFNDVGIEIGANAAGYYTKKTYLVPGVCCWLTKTADGWLPVFSKAPHDNDRPICHPALTSLVGTEDWDVAYADALQKSETVSDAIEVLAKYLADPNVCDQDLVKEFGTTYANTQSSPWRDFRSQGSAAHKRYAGQPKRRARKSFDLPEILLSHGLIESAEVETAKGLKINCNCKSGVNLGLKLYPLTVTRDGKTLDLDNRTKKRLSRAILDKDWQRVADVMGSLSQKRRQKKDSSKAKTR